jgi:hypothetical protein
VDYWAVEFGYPQRKEIIKVRVGLGLSGNHLASRLRVTARRTGCGRFRGTLDRRLFESEWKTKG